MCKLCEKVLRPHGDCMFCPECGELFAKISVPATSPDGDNFGYVTTGTKIRGRWSEKTAAQRRTKRRTTTTKKAPTPVQGGLFDG